MFSRDEIIRLRQWGEALSSFSDWPDENAQLLERLKAMTTDPEEGRRQAETMQPEPIKVGDRVKLSAGGDRVMTVVALEDYGNMAVCDWETPGEQVSGTPEGMLVMKYRREPFPVRSLVRVPSKVEGA